MLSQRLKEARKRSKLTQEELAKMVKTKKTTISNYETGYSSPSNEMLNDLADALRVSADYLLGRTNDPSPIENEKPYDSLAEITKYVQSLGVTSMGFFDIEKWKNLSPDDVEMLKRNFDTIVEMAERRKKQNK